MDLPLSRSGTHRIFQQLMEDWTRQSRSPDCALAGCSSEFADVFAQKPNEFSFETFQHASPRPGWAWNALEFRDFFSKPLHFYWPETWDNVRQKDRRAQVSERGLVRQSLFLLDKASWAETLDEFFDRTRIVAFSCIPRSPPAFLHWTFCAGRNGPQDAWWVWSIFTAAETLIVVKGDAWDAATLERQLVSSVNSDPWRDWIPSPGPR